MILVSDEDAVTSRRLTWLRRWLALSGLLLVAATWRLWTPQVVFPQIPFFAVLRTVPGGIDWLALVGMLVSLIGLLVAPSEPRPSGSGSLVRIVAKPLPDGRGSAWAILFVASLAVLILLDQHRFQPWAYQFAIVAIVLAFAPAGRAVSLLRLLTVGIYFWSAVSKLDYTFLHGLGPELIRGMLAAFQLDPGWMRPEAATVFSLAFPLDELAVALSLTFRRTRTFGLIASIAMHVLLLATLGPLGLNHSFGVLLWNVYFIGQNVLLFVPMASRGRQTAGQERTAPSTVPLSLVRGVRGEGSEDRSVPPCAHSSADRSEQAIETNAAARHFLTPAPLPRGKGNRHRERQEANGHSRGLTPAARLAHWVVYAAIVMPVLEPFGWLDHWPGWAVYAPAGERVQLQSWLRWRNEQPQEVRAGGFKRMELPNGRPRLDHWSLDQLSVPMYPDERFHVGVSLAVAERIGAGAHWTLDVKSRADRFTGERDTILLGGTAEIREYAESFWLNALPRKLGGW